MKQADKAIDSAEQVREELEKIRTRFDDLLQSIAVISPDIDDRYNEAARPIEATIKAMEASDQAILMADFLLHEPKSAG